MSDPKRLQIATIGEPCLTAEGVRLRYTDMQISPKQAAFLSLTNREALFGGAGGGGKDLRISTEILTTGGWSTIGALKVGDRVLSHDGNPTTVIAKSDVFTDHKLYRVTMTDGEEIIASETHRWNVATERQRQNYQRTDPVFQSARRAKRVSRGRSDVERVDAIDRRAHGTADSARWHNSRRATEHREGHDRPSIWDYTTTMTTAEIIEVSAAERSRMAIPNGAPIYGDMWLSDIPPYTLGVWLGDGDSKEGTIAVAESDLATMTAELEADRWTVETSTVMPPRCEGYQPVHILRLVDPNGVSLRTKLDREGYLGNKHVPEWAVLAPYADRQALIGGFFDTDGYVCETRGRIEFCLAVQHMVEAVHTLLWSIGEQPTAVKHRKTRNQVEGFEGDAWRFQLSGSPTYLFRMPRKRDRLTAGSTTNRDYRYIASIEEIPPEPTQCIQVDNDRGLFRVGRTFLVTHNSVCGLAGALQFCDVPGYNALILRKNLTDLKLPDGLIDVSRDWLDGKGPRYNANDHRWTFPSGAVLQFGNMSKAGSELRYKSSQFQYIFFDELTEFPWQHQYTYMFSRLRKQKNSTFGAAPDGLTLNDVPLRIRAATNPGGVGQTWVSARFVSDEAIRPFMPAKLVDNPGIDHDEYRESLAELSEVERRRLEDGDWNVFEIPGALWKFSEIGHTDTVEIAASADVDVRAIAIDPSVSEETKHSDECGIIMGSITAGKVTVEADFSGKMHPDAWAKRAVLQYHAYGCTRLVVEDNQGGELVVSQVGNMADILGVARPRVVKVTAKESKEARAAKAHTAYGAQRLVLHNLGLQSGSFEAQLTSWIPGTGRSPDRLDAGVWLIRHLLFGDGDTATYRTPSTIRSIMSDRMAGSV